MRCREIWNSKYPFESFENEAGSGSDSQDTGPVVSEGSLGDDFLFKEVEKQRLLCSLFAEPYRSEVVYLIAARQRYKAFLFMMQRFACESSSRLVPTSDILLMWLTHQVCLQFDFHFLSFFFLVVFLDFPYLSPFILFVLLNADMQFIISYPYSSSLNYK